jgi:Protein of unknown function (DUF3574)
MPVDNGARGTDAPYREATHVLVILYKADATTDGKIETIRGAYKKQFHQENPLSGSTPSSAPLFDGSLATFSSRRKRI